MRALRLAAVAASCLVPLCPAVCAAAVDAGGSVALTSDDVYRGVSMTCGYPAAQADVHAREIGASGWAAFIGVWGSAGLNHRPCGSARELDFYAGYNVALSPDVSATFTYTRYTFPGGYYFNPYLAGERYDYDELSTTWGIMDRLYLSLAWTPDAVGYKVYEGEFETTQSRSALSYGLDWRQPLVSWLSLDASAGYDRIADPFGTGYGFWSLGLTHQAGPLELDFAYFHTSDRAEWLFGPDSAGGRVSATVLWRF
jgi:uncharacterized protein (TIGR02001 family)